MKHGIILFDGDCHFCNSSVQFVIKRDHAAYFQFASLQSEIGQRLLTQYHVPKTIDSMVLIEQDHAYIESTAALKICRNLDGGWPVCYAFIIVPAPIRNYFYRLFAKHRYRLFGQTQHCMLPTPSQRQRFLS
ncbi:thiol-disulfide oxidoreductase DCC family protein [Lysinibacillus piscis]|uniref:DUF393 domain-containing protein n=1 Tax=Lysinibacillus piscis TaxID=2518931 RepID=A0ABQ5NK41_9BACI|nr:thiol-disulfide oxidoreductase DCC family protein [Lysinibacillus sp. KH24]GLC88446.1 hypothetical protein LYSBPC_15730 [Lysinibacillus sp. KH24]